MKISQLRIGYVEQAGCNRNRQRVKAKHQSNGKRRTAGYRTTGSHVGPPYRSGSFSYEAGNSMSVSDSMTGSACIISPALPVRQGGGKELSVAGCVSIRAR